MRTANRIVGLALGSVFVLLGIAGFVAAPGGGPLLWVLQVNPLQNVVHVVLGAALLAAALWNLRASRTANAVLGALLLVLGLAGLFLVGSPVDVLALNPADNALHFAGAAVLLAVGLGADRPEAV